MGVRGQTSDTKPMDIDPFVETFIAQPTLIGRKGQTEEEIPHDVVVIKPEVREGIIQALTTTREDILASQGMLEIPKPLAEALAEKGPLGEVVGGVAVAPIESLMLLGGKALKIPVMEKTPYPRTAFGLQLSALSL